MSERPVLNQQQSGLLRLPREIRDIIYRYALVAPVPVHLAIFYAYGWNIASYPCQGFRSRRIAGPTYDPDHYKCLLLQSEHKIDEDACDALRVVRQGAGIPFLGLLRSCQKIYTEAIDILYQDNTFCIEKPRLLNSIFDHLPENGISAIRHLSIQSECWREEPGDEDDEDDDSDFSPVTSYRNPDILVFLVPFVGLRREKKALEDPLIQASLSQVDMKIEFRPMVKIDPACRMHFPQYTELFESTD